MAPQSFPGGVSGPLGAGPMNWLQPQRAVGPGSLGQAGRQVECESADDSTTGSSTNCEGVLNACDTEIGGLPAAIDHPSGFLALNPRNRHFQLANQPGFIPYREQGRDLIAFGGIHAAAADCEALLDGFVQYAQSLNRRVVFVQVRERQTPLFISRGFVVNQFGTSFGMNLGRFTLSGAKKMQLRNKINRARKLGLTVVEVGRDVPADERVFGELRLISKEWLRKKGKELDFMVGELGDPKEVRRRIFVVLEPSSRAIGFITYVPVWGKTPGYLHDLTRRLPAAPPGAMELCNAFAIERMTTEGVTHLHFGFTPFITDALDQAGSNRILAWAIQKLRRYGSFIYPSESQARYKLKWGPHIIEREYIAALPLSMRCIVDLLILTRSI